MDNSSLLFLLSVGSPMAGQILFRAVLFPSYFQVSFQLSSGIYSKGHGV